MRQAAFAQFTRACIDERNLLEARMIITTYNQHVRLLSSEPFGWFAPPKFTRAWEPTLLWNHSACAVKRRWSTAGESPARELGSLHPEAIGAAVEETKPSEPLV